MTKKVITYLQKSNHFFKTTFDYSIITKSVSISENPVKSSKKRPGHLTRSFKILCAPSGARTLDTLIKSQVLYQLS